MRKKKDAFIAIKISVHGVGVSMCSRLDRINFRVSSP